MPVSSSVAQTVKGSLDLEFIADEQGRTCMKKCYRTGLFHLSKPYREGTGLALQLVNPTAGIFENDRVESRLTVGDGAKACLLSPSSTQVYAMPNGSPATAVQEIQVTGNGALVMLPKWLVLHKRARFCQSTRIEIGPDASLFLLDQVSAGRAAFGEFMEYDEYSSSTEIRVGGALVLKEKFRCGHKFNRWIWRSGGRECSYLSNAYIAFPGAADICQQLMASGSPLDGLSGCFSTTGLTPDFVVMRFLGSNAFEVQQILELVCDVLSPYLPFSRVHQRMG